MAVGIHLLSLRGDADLARSDLGGFNGFPDTGQLGKFTHEFPRLQPGHFALHDLHGLAGLLGQLARVLGPLRVGHVVNRHGPGYAEQLGVLVEHKAA